MSETTWYVACSLWAFGAILYLIAFNMGRFGRYVREALWMAATFLMIGGILRVLSDAGAFSEEERRYLLVMPAVVFSVMLLALAFLGHRNGRALG